MRIPKNLLLNLLITILMFSFVEYDTIGFAQQEEPEKSVVVKDYTWASGGMGRSAVLRDITLQNTSINEYKNIEIELELFDKNDIPLGSLRGTIRDSLPPGSEKTFMNVNFGIMHSDQHKSFARVVTAELIEKGTPTHPRHLILVKDWKWEGGQYGTEAILGEITLVNRSNRNFKDIKLRVSDLGVSGPKVGPEGYTTNFVINDFIPAGATKTFKNVNVGFRHPDSTGNSIYVLNAKPISKKEIRYRITKDRKSKGIKTSEQYYGSEGIEYTEPEEKLSLAERYRLKLKEEDEKARASTTKSDSGTSSDVKEKIEISPENKIEENLEEDYDIAGIDEKEVAIPEHDIEILDFKWGSGVPGSIGILKEITLRNISGITYTKIDLVVDFLSRQGVPLASNDFKLYEILPPGETRTFENIKVGIIVVLPDEKNMKVTIKDATDLN